VVNARVNPEDHLKLPEQVIVMTGSREPTPDGHAEQPSLALPDNLARPAQRALAEAGYTRLEQLAAVSEAEIARLHGIGPNARKQLRQALAAHGLSFAAAPGKQG
jgi:hypothetical protein